MVKKLYSRVQLILFGNKIGYLYNILHVVYSFILGFKRIISKKASYPTEVNNYVSELKLKGFCVLRPEDGCREIEHISSKVDGLFARPEKCVVTLEQRGLVRLKNGFYSVPELSHFLEIAGDILKNYYGNHFSVFSSDLYRTFQKSVDQSAFDSNLYHFDNAPQSTIKMMIYLTDTKKNSGAITVCPKLDSVKLKRGGFWDRHNNQNYITDIEECASPIEAPAGTVILFAPQNCIHKATLPEQGYRDVAVFLIYPRTSQVSEINDEYRMQCDNFYGYLKNPFVWKPLRLGDE